jgi:hypothetical protein
MHVVGARGEEIIAYIGEVVAKEVAEQPEEGVWVAHLGGAAPIPVECVVRSLWQWGRITLEEDDVVAITGQVEGRHKPGYARPDDDNPQVWPLRSVRMIAETLYRCCVHCEIEGMSGIRPAESAGIAVDISEALPGRSVDSVRPNGSSRTMRAVLAVLAVLASCAGKHQPAT